MSYDNLSKLLDALTETSVYVIEEKTHKLLYFNRHCSDTGLKNAVTGAKCHEIWPDKCADCPLKALGSGQSAHIVRYDAILQTDVFVTANRMLWDGHIPAVAVTAAPRRLNTEKVQELHRTEKMYGQSLITVFDECMIVNLTANYFMNCRRDMDWGEFSESSGSYADLVIHPDDLAVFKEHFSYDALLRLFGQGRKQITKRLRRLCADGTYRMMEFTAAALELSDDDDSWCVLVYRDVQDEYVLEQRRNVELSQLAAAAGITCQMLIAVNLTQNTFHMLGYERFQVKNPGSGGCFDDLIEAELATVHPDYKEEFINKFSRGALIEAFTGKERIVTMKVPHIGEDGVCHWHFTQVVRVESPYTNDIIEITLSRNIDEERCLEEETLDKERRAKMLLEEALDKAEKASKAKSDFLSKMSHDIRTPMNAILGMTELAQVNISDAEKLKDYLQKIAGSGSHLLSLINEILDVSKIESGTVRLEEAEFDLRDLIHEAAELVRLPFEAKRQTLNVNIENDLYPQVRGDARRLKQILVNILENASKYTGEKGTVTLSAKQLKKPEQLVGTYRFTVEDNGAGMTPEFLANIFDPFTRADDSRISKIPGAGLGMTIVKNLVNLMGGDIQVNSELGKGSQFIITLALLMCDAHEQSDNLLLTEEDFSDLRILLVEDNKLNQQIAAEMLELMGAQVEIAENGGQAVELVTSKPPFFYDAVLMDIQMPVLNGYEAAKAIRNSGMPQIDCLPIIAMTADAFAEDVRQARLADMNGHLAKPVSMKRLKRVLSGCRMWKQSCYNTGNTPVNRS